jgi:hypothetical protein
VTVAGQDQDLARQHTVRPKMRGKPRSQRAPFSSSRRRLGRCGTNRARIAANASAVAVNATQASTRGSISASIDPNLTLPSSIEMGKRFTARRRWRRTKPFIWRRRAFAKRNVVANRSACGRADCAAGSTRHLIDTTGAVRPVLRSSFSRMLSRQARIPLRIRLEASEHLVGRNGCARR